MMCLHPYHHRRSSYIAPAAKAVRVGIATALSARPKTSAQTQRIDRFSRIAPRINPNRTIEPVFVYVAIHNAGVVAHTLIVDLPSSNEVVVLSMNAETVLLSVCDPFHDEAEQGLVERTNGCPSAHDSR